MNSRPLVRVNRALGWDKFELRFGRIGTGGETYVAQPVRMEKHVKHAEVLPTFIMENDECQMLMDELYAAGFRPTEGRDSKGALKATELHLADMQRISFMLLQKAGARE